MCLGRERLEVHCAAARGLPRQPGGSPDSFLKTFLREGDRVFLRTRWEAREEPREAREAGAGQHTSCPGAAW